MDSIGVWRRLLIKLKAPIAARGVRQESQLADTFLSLLDFHGSRFGVSQVIAVLESRAVQRRFSLSEEDLEPIHLWVRDTRIRWGVDQESRKALGLPEFRENSWRAGLERMLLGYSMPGQGEKMFKGVLPYDMIQGNEAVVLGNFTAFSELLFALAKELDEPRNLREWGDFLTTVLDDFFLAGEEAERDILFIRRVLWDLGEKQDLSGFDEKITLGVIKSHLGSSLEKEGFGHLAAIEACTVRAGLRAARLGVPGAGDADVVVVDRVGVVGDLYALADVAYVGGGFHAAGLHSVIEPAAFGAPVLFGPQCTDSRDAGLLIAALGGRTAANAQELGALLGDWLATAAARRKAGERARELVSAGTGAAERSYALVEALLLLHRARQSATECHRGRQRCALRPRVQ